MTQLNLHLLNEIRPELKQAIQLALEGDGKIQGIKEKTEIAYAAIADGDLTTPEKELLAMIQDGSTSELIRYFNPNPLANTHMNFPVLFGEPTENVGQAILQQAENFMAQKNPKQPLGFVNGADILINPTFAIFPGKSTSDLFALKPLELESPEAMIKKALFEAIRDGNIYSVYTIMADLGSYATHNLTDTTSDPEFNQLLENIQSWVKSLPSAQQKTFKMLLNQMAEGIVPPEVIRKDQESVQKWEQALEKMKPDQRKGIHIKPLSKANLQQIAWVYLATDMHHLSHQIQNQLIKRLQTGEFSEKDAIALAKTAQALPKDQQQEFISASQDYFSKTLQTGSSKDKEKAAFALSRLAETTRTKVSPATRENILKLAEATPSSNTALRLSTVRMLQWNGSLDDFAVESISQNFEASLADLIKNPPSNLKDIIEKYKAACNLDRISHYSPKYYDDDALDLIPRDKNFAKIAAELWNTPVLQQEVQKRKLVAIQNGLGKNNPQTVATDLAGYILSSTFQRRLDLLPEKMQTELMQHELQKLQVINPELATQTALKLSASVIQSSLVEPLKNASDQQIDHAIEKLTADKNQNVILANLGWSKEMLTALDALPKPESQKLLSDLAKTLKGVDWNKDNASEITQKISTLLQNGSQEAKKVYALLLKEGPQPLKGLAGAVGFVKAHLADPKNIPSILSTLCDISLEIGERVAGRAAGIVSQTLSKQPVWLNTLKGVGLVAAKVATIVDIMNLAETINRKDTGGAVGQGVKLVGGMIGGAAAGLWFLGAASAGPVGWVAAGFVGAGMLIDAIFSDSKEEKEVKKLLDTLGIPYAAGEYPPGSAEKEFVKPHIPNTVLKGTL